MEPALPLLLLLAIFSLFRMWRRSRSGERPWLMTIAILGLVLVSAKPAAWLFSRPLEIGYDQNPIPSGKADAIVVLAGAVSPALPNRPYPLAGSDTYIRIQHAVWLFKQWGARPILACGGGIESEASSQVFRRLFEIEGVPPDLIWIEPRSRSTHENALYGQEILRQHGISRIALVTDARSMVRAEASFRKQGLTVVPAPFRFYNLDFEFGDLIPSPQAIEANGDTAHELVGLFWYRLHRWI